MWCILVCTKEADEVMHVYLVNVYSKFGESHKILLDNGTEFENLLFVKAASTLGIKQMCSSQMNNQKKVHCHVLKGCIMPLV